MMKANIITKLPISQSKKVEQSSLQNAFMNFLIQRIIYQELIL